MPFRLTGRPIGGFLPLGIADLPAAAATPWQRWTDGARSALGFRNARSALAWLLREKSIRRVWLPAYICPELAVAARGAGADPAFYSVGETLAPDVAGLDAAMRRGDAAIGVDYFGFSPPAEFTALVEARDDVLWIEDRAQALDPGATPWGDWLLYSPRKLVGVPDGGILVSRHETLADPLRPRATDFDFLSPALMRLEDTEEADHCRWYAQYRAVEQANAVSLQPMSRLSFGLLCRMDAAAISAARRRNFACLSHAFSDLALPSLGAGTSAVPFGLAIRVGDAAALAGRLAEAGMFCARHWAALPCAPEAFAAEHGLARSLLTLPCDQRYGEAEMKRLIDAVAAALS
jgi:dTDP-4-amino-4,6-dideoxygalactose transaminase